VSIDALDRSACGGTHVRATGEIGVILVRKIERARKLTRVEFVCGLRAIRRARADLEALSDIAQQLSASIDEAPSLVRAQREELKESASARRALETRLATHEARARWEAAPLDARGVHRIVERRAAGGVEPLRALAQAMTALPDTLFVGASSEPPGVIVATSEGSGLDAGALLKRALAGVGGRGGGSPRLAQGTVPDPAALDRVLDALAREGA
jgi:alanyl-tRNA synthetase